MSSLIPQQLTLANILVKNVITISVDSGVHDTLLVMRDRKISAVVVVEDIYPVGLFTERDVVNLTHQGLDLHTLMIRDVMSSPLITALSHLDYQEGYTLLKEHKVRHLVVTDEIGRLAGIVSESDFLRHLGGEFLLKFKDAQSVMNPSVITLTEAVAVADAVHLMAQAKISCIVIERSGFPVGMFTERDLLRLDLAPEKINNVLIGSVMTQPVHTISAETLLPEALSAMEQLKIRRLVVLNIDNTLAGLLTRQDVTRQIHDGQIKQLKEVLQQKERQLQEAQLALEVKEELNEIRSRLHAIIETVPHGIQENDCDGNITFSNASHHKLLGYMEGEIVGTKIWDSLAYDSDRLNLQNHLKVLVVDRLKPQPIVLLHSRKDGQQIWMQTDWNYQYDAKGDLLGFISIITDITKQKIAESALRAEHALQHKYLETMDTIMVALDRKGIVTMINRAGCETLGYKESEVVGSNWFKKCLPQPEGGGKIYGVFQDLIKGRLENTEYYENYVLRRDGEQRLIAWHNAFLTDDVGKITGVLSSGQDITEKQQTENKLLESQALYQGYFNHASNPIFIIDAPNDRILDANPKASEVLGYTHDELLNTCVSQIHPMEMEQLQLFAQLIFTNGSAVTDRLSCLTKDGVNIPSIISGAFVPYQGKQAILATVIDIRERLVFENKLALADEEWTQAMNQLNQAVYLLDMQRNLVRANHTFYRIIDSSPEKCVGQHIAKLIHPNGEEDICPVCQMQEDREEKTIILEADNVHNPTNTPLEVSLKIVRDDANSPTGMLMSLSDLSQSRKTEERLRLFANVFDNTAEGVIVTNRSGSIVEVNKSFTAITGYSRQEVIGKNPKLLSSGRHHEDYYQNMWRSLEDGGHWSGEIWNRHKDGGIYPEWQNINTVTDDNGELTHYVGVFSDISKIKKSQELLDHLAHHDALTDLPNRLLLNERLEQAIRHAARQRTQIAVLFIDLDHFKHINDSFGHPAGDRLLQQAGDYILNVVRKDDTVARLGGDEFVILLEDVKKVEIAGVIAQKLLAEFNKPITLEQRDVFVTASVGICVYPQDGRNAADLLRNADSAMYLAKNEGRNTYRFYTEELTRNVFERVLIENDLRQALTNDQLVLYFQPQINLQTGKLIGAEALIRWQHPQLGLVSPNKFISVSEESGLIVSIGKWVLNQACVQAKEWLDKGYDVGRIAVNVAGPQIQQGDLADQVSFILANTRLPASLLELEVTENFIMQNAESAISRLAKLRDLGVRLSIDDFGTGYSSLSYLKRLPIQKLKIDQSFIRGIPSDSDDVAITKAIIALTKGLDLTVIAEGVETDEQANFLAAEGCNEVQGFLFDEPLSADDFEKRLRTYASK